MSRELRRTFSQEFQATNRRSLLSWKATCRIIREYELTASAFDKWVKAI